MTESYIIEFQKRLDRRGNLTFLQYPDNIPFEIKNIYWSYDIPGGIDQSGYELYTNEEVIISLSGSFDIVVIYPNNKEERYYMNRTYYGLYVPSNAFRHLENFSTNSVALHISN